MFPEKFSRSSKISFWGIYEKIEREFFFALTNRVSAYIMRNMNKINTLTRRVNCGTFQRESQMLEAAYRETVENYLRVALIRSGDSVIIS